MEKTFHRLVAYNQMKPIIKRNKKMNKILKKKKVKWVY